MKKSTMTYTEFVQKWANRALYETPHDYHSRSVGRIHMYRHDNFPSSHGTVIADVYLLPKAIGWRDAKQKAEFYRDAKCVGVRPKQMMEWYKVIDLC